MKQFSLGTELWFGSDALDRLKLLHVKKALVVTDDFFYRNGLAQTVLQKTGAEGEIFHEVVPDPPASLSAKGAALMEKLRPELLIALGGGSSMDCAKGMILAAEKRPCFIAIPTTSGTGSEVTSFSILTHNGVKHAMVDKSLRPDYAVLDESLLQNLPKNLIAEAGMDAVTHCVEAICAKNGSLVTEAMASHACRTLLSLLPRSINGETAVRGQVHLAATMAGIAFDNAGLGLLHAIIHALGGAFHIPHGRLGGIMLPHVMEFNKEAALGQYASLATACGLGGATEILSFRDLKRALCKLRQQLHLPSTLSEAGIKKAELEQQLSSLAAAAWKDGCLAGNPRAATEDDIKKLLREAFQ